MLKIEIVYIGSLNNNWQDLREHYEKLLKRLLVLEFKELKSQSFNEKDKHQAIIAESERIDKYLNKKNSANIFLLSETGKTFDSIAFANFLKQFDALELILVIGGALGFSQEIKNKYSRLSLSPLTFPHQMSQIILLEQIYRSITLINKKNYHY